MFAFLIIDMPMTSQDWSTALHNIVNEKKPLKGTEKMSITTYKIDLSQGLDSLHELMDVAKDNQYPCHVSFFPDEPSFATSNLKDKS